jgi:hypothetical protein
MAHYVVQCQIEFEFEGTHPSVDSARKIQQIHDGMGHLTTALSKLLSLPETDSIETSAFQARYPGD